MLNGKRITEADAAQILDNHLKNTVGDNNVEIDKKSLRYVIYTRKSTLGDERQEKSIEQQIDECKKIAEREELTVVGKPIEERGSAKVAGTRDEFNKLLVMIRERKIDGIIAWHPDRLARNMKEAGDIIDLIDRGVLLDLQFATFSFENTATGKMLLGITFVLSKAYSENLAANVLRGNKHHLLDNGRYLGKNVHGYILTKDSRRLEPDSNYFALIKKAFEMRTEGATEFKIAKFLNHAGYMAYHYEKGHRKYEWTKARVSKMLRDTVYCGALVYGKNYIWISDYYDFEPVVSKADFLSLHQSKSLSDGKFKLARTPRTEVKADLYRSMVFCETCGKSMSTGMTSKKVKATGDKRLYFYFRCETEHCEFKNSSAKGSLIVNFMAGFLEEFQFTTQDNYETYLKQHKERLKDHEGKLKQVINSMSAKIAQNNSSLEDIKRIIRETGDKTTRAYFEEDLRKYSKQINEYEAVRKVARKERDELNASSESYEKYLELIQKTPVILRKRLPLKSFDNIGKIFFTNFTLRCVEKGKKGKASRWEVATFKLKEPYDGFYNSGNFIRGRG